MSRDFSIAEVQNAGERVSPLLKDRNFQVHKDVYRFALPFAGKDVIDLGSGSGSGAAIFPEGTRIRGFEFDQTAVEYARQTFGSRRVTFQEADLNQPLDCGTADLVFSSNVFEHLLDVRQAIQTAMSAMRAKSTFVLAIPCIIEPSRLNQELLNPYHFTSFSYPFWQDTLKLCFDVVEPNIQFVLCPNYRFERDPEGHVHTLRAFAEPPFGHPWMPVMSLCKLCGARLCTLFGVKLCRLSGVNFQHGAIGWIPRRRAEART